MQNGGSLIFDVSAGDFQEKVADVSMTVLVMVDFWAEWCGPCKALGPLLERITESYGGAVLLARVDVDQNRELSMRFGIKSIPTVKFFRNGEVVDEFVGVQPEAEIRAIIDSFSGDDAGKLLARAQELLEADRVEDATAVYVSILEGDPGHSGARIGLARIRIAMGEDEPARELLGGIEETDARYEEARALLGLFDLITECERAGGLDTCLAATGANPDDLQARYLLGCCHVAADSWRDALDTFLSIVKRDRGFGEGKARKAMLVLFSAAGDRSDLTEEYRKKLAMVLF